MTNLWDFDEKSQVDGLDVDSRPNSTTFSRKVAYDVGPIARYDTGEGLRDWVWRARLDGTKVFLCRETDAKDGWGEEEELFEAGEGVDEISLSWDQNARPTVVFSQGGMVKLYWYDPTIETTTIQSIAAGRNPVVYLDDREPLNVSSSDVLIFLVQESTDRIFYVRQRDRYDTAYVLPGISGVGNKYLELVMMGLDRRLYIFYTEYDDAAACEIVRGASFVSSKVVRSSVFPLVMEREEYEVGGSVLLNGSMKEVIIEYELGNIEDYEVSGSEILSGSLFTKMLVDTIDIEDYEVSGSAVISGSLFSKMLADTIDIEDYEVSGSEILSGSLFRVMLQKTIEVASYEVSGSAILSGSLLEV